MTDTPPLSVGEFSDALDRLGPHLDRWPADAKAAAQALLATSSQAAGLLADALALAEAVAGASPKAPDGFVDRVMAASGADGRKS
jgi:hypothetical protein